MTKRKDVIYFIENNAEGKIETFANHLRENISSSIKYSNLLTRWLISLVIFYYLLSESLIEKLNLPYVEINNLEFLKQAILPLFGIIIFFYVITGCYRAELIQVLNHIFLRSHKLSKNDTLDHKFNSINDLVRISTPTSYFAELNKFKKKGSLSWQNVLYFTYLFILQIIPFLFIFNGLSFIYTNHFDSAFGIMCFIFTLLSILCSLTYFCNFILNGLDVEQL